MLSIQGYSLARDFQNIWLLTYRIGPAVSRRRPTSHSIQYVGDAATCPVAARVKLLEQLCRNALPTLGSLYTSCEGTFGSCRRLGSFRVRNDISGLGPVRFLLLGWWPNVSRCTPTLVRFLGRWCSWQFDRRADSLTSPISSDGKGDVMRKLWMQNSS